MGDPRTDLEVDLEAVRREIDAVDEGILDLVARRLDLARAAGEAKGRLGRSMVDPEREARVAAAWRERASRRGVDGEIADGLRAVIVAAARRAQGA